MHTFPDTRASLIVRLRDDDSEAAWEEFISIYRPAIVRTAITRGLQSSDAEDLAQQVLIAVAKKVPDWEINPQRGRFRTWLGQIVRNAASNALSRRAFDRGLGGTKGIHRFDQQPAPAEELKILELEWRREAFRWAADRIRDEFQPKTWDAFWLVTVESLDANEAAKRTGKSVGAVYVAKSRVMQRLQEVVHQLDGELPEVAERC